MENRNSLNCYCTLGGLHWHNRKQENSLSWSDSESFSFPLSLLLDRSCKKLVTYGGWASESLLVLRWHCGGGPCYHWTRMIDPISHSVFSKTCQGTDYKGWLIIVQEEWNSRVFIWPLLMGVDVVPWVSSPSLPGVRLSLKVIVWKCLSCYVALFLVLGKVGFSWGLFCWCSHWLFQVTSFFSLRYRRQKENPGVIVSSTY